jgi:hypothetical protein
LDDLDEFVGFVVVAAGVVEEFFGPCQRSGTTPEPTVQDQASNNSDDSAADSVQRDHADQQECEHHEGCAALPGAVSACVDHCRNADQKRNGEEHPAGLGEPKPVTEPSPIASKPRHT